MKIFWDKADAGKLKKILGVVIVGGIFLFLFDAAASAADNRDRGRPGNQQGMRARQAEERRGERDWQDHEVRARHYWSRPNSNRPHPRVVYAPPLIYAPPPQYYDEPSVSFIIPLNIY